MLKEIVFVIALLICLAWAFHLFYFIGAVLSKQIKRGRKKGENENKKSKSERHV